MKTHILNLRKNRGGMLEINEIVTILTKVRREWIFSVFSKARTRGNPTEVFGSSFKFKTMQINIV